MADEPATSDRVFVVPDDADRQRVDRFVTDVSGLSRSYVQKLISDGRLMLDGRPIKANAVVGPGDRARARGPGRSSRWPSRPRRSRSIVVYEDDDLLIVDKPAGLVVHPAPGHPDRDPRERPARHGPAGATTAGSPGSQRPGHRPSPRPRHERSAHGREERRCPGQSSWRSSRRAASRRRTSRSSRAAWPRTPAGSRRRSGAIRGIGRGWRSCRTAVRRSPATGSASGSRLDAPRARPRHRPDPPDPGPSRGDRPPGGGRPGLRRREPHGAGRRASTGSSCTPGGSSSRRRRAGSSSARRRRSRPSSRRLVDRLARGTARSRRRSAPSAR